MDDRLLSILQENVEAGNVQPVSVLIQFQDEAARSILIPGIDVHYSFASIPAVYALAPPATILALSEDPAVRFIEADKPVRYHMSSAVRASLARDVFDPSWRPETPAILDAEGDLVDGRGVGIAVVDTGLDATHPAFTAPGKVAGHFLVTAQGPVAAAAYTVTNAHGTHVAGIAAGTGGGSAGGVEKGAAPGAALYVFAIAPADTTGLAAVAFDWILQNGAQSDPPIRVVLNAWGCDVAACGVWNPDLTHNRLASALADAGILVVFAVGNDAGNGFMANVAAEATNPTPGVLGVADYEDQNSGLRVACLAKSSSRGQAADATTWPDLAAPGRSSWSPHPIELSEKSRLPTGPNTYREFGGTSAAAAHVAGVAALLYQAKPGLLASDVEYLLKDTATPLSCGETYVRADSAHPWTPAHFGAGHGLVDAHAAALRAPTFAGVPEPVDVEPVPDAWKRLRTGIAPETTLWFARDGTLSAEFPERGDVHGENLWPGMTMAYESQPFDAPATHGAAWVTYWAGMSAESIGVRFTAPRLAVAVDRIAADGAALRIAESSLQNWFVTTLAPVMRPFAMPFGSAVAFDPGDRVRVTVAVTNPSYVGGLQVPLAARLYVDAWHAPSRIVLGEPSDTLPDTFAHCSARHDCAVLEHERRVEGVDCGPGPWRLDWEGPPGSFVALSCHGIVYTCTVPGAPGGAWAACHRVIDVKPVPSNNKGSTCSWWTPDATRPTGVAGGCTALRLVEDED